MMFRYPRAAVAVTVQCAVKDNNQSYLLVKRGKPPDQGMWSLPGGKLDLGEMALAGGKRELAEETKFDEMPNLCWYPGTFTSTDAIFQKSDGSFTFHYLIAHCFARFTADSLPNVVSADDAKEAKWWTLDAILETEEPISAGVEDVIKRAEALYERGGLQ
jgi:8-oxo-dGTP diphosphatase